MLPAMGRNQSKADVEIYHYVDDDGSDVVTNDLASVPQQYRGRLEVAGTKAPAAPATSLLPADFHGPSFALGAGTVAFLAVGALALRRAPRVAQLAGVVVMLGLLLGGGYLASVLWTADASAADDGAAGPERRGPIDAAKKAKSKIEQMRAIEEEIERQR